MRLINALYIALLSGLTLTVSAQDSEIQPSENLNGTLEQQFDYIYKRSNNYEIYKVVSKKNFEHLKKSSLDSIRVYKNEINTLNSKLSSEIQERDNLSTQLTSLKEDYLKVNEEKESVSFFGIRLDNNLFNMIILGVFIFLVLLLFFFIMKFKSAKSEARIVVDNLTKVEEEYADYKRRAMEKEQQLGRRLQDEINKHKNKEQ